MNIQLQQILLALIPLIITPYAVAHAFSVGASLYHRITARLPANQRATLDYAARKAVSMAEQKYKSLPGTEKRMCAERAFYALCQHFDIPAPDRTVMDTLIESAVAALDKAVAGTISEDTTKAVALQSTKS
jgi:hypothetical protein